MASPTFKYSVINYVDAAQLKKDLSYSTNNLSDAMVGQASLFAHYGVQSAKASMQVDTIKMLLETAEAAVYRQLADRTATAGGKVVVASLDKDVAADERIINLKRSLNEAKQIEKASNTAVEAFRHRRDMLVQQGFLSREEMRGEVSVALKQAKDQEFENSKNNALASRQALLSRGA